VTRDDQVLPQTRLLGAVIVPFLLVAFALLYLFPDDTAHWFAWPIKPRMTPLIMGAGYISGSYFFVRVVLARRWHTVHLGFLPITAFTVFMAVATFGHLDRFDKHHVAFWIWTALYVATPVLVPLVWWRNHATDPRRPERGDVVLPAQLRRVLLAAGGVQSVVATILLLSPSTMIDVWPWALTPLTAQVLGGWFALPGVVALLMAIDGRWSAIRVTLHSQLIGLSLILLGVIRAWDDFDTSNAVTYLFVGGLGALLGGLIALDVYMNAMEHRVSGGGRPFSAPAGTPTS
jgi:hypothetical protein